MSEPLSICRWKNAKTDPPPTRFAELEPVLMEVDGAVIPGWWNNRDWFDWECSSDSPDMPDRWAAMPSPPGDDALTMDDLVRVLRRASRNKEGLDPRYGIAATPEAEADALAIARLRHALEEAEGM